MWRTNIDINDVAILAERIASRPKKRHGEAMQYQCYGAKPCGRLGGASLDSSDRYFRPMPSPDAPK